MAAVSTAVARPQARPRPSSARSRLALVVTRRLGVGARPAGARRAVAVSATLVVGALLVITAAQAVVDDQQVRIDDLQQQVAQSVASNENLQLNRAALVSPSRILQIAKSRLDMVTPSSVTYLAPVNPGPPAFPRANDVRS